MSISLKELKKNRFTPAEKWVLERIDGAEPEIQPDVTVDWYDKYGKWLFTQYFEGRELYVVYSFWSDLVKEFGLNRDEIQDLLTNLLYDYTDNGKLEIKTWGIFL